jgi:hypothetical protein
MNSTMTGAARASVIGTQRHNTDRKAKLWARIRLATVHPGREKVFMKTKG